MKFSVVDGRIFNPGDLSWDGFRALAEVTVTNFETEPPLAAVIDCLQGSQGAMLRQRVVKRELLEACPELKFIDLTSTGYDQVDRETLDYAARHGVTICNIPAYGTPAVAQHTFALLLELCNQVGHYDRAVKAGRWGESGDFCLWDRPMAELWGKTMGIVGLGSIGQAVAAIAHGFGMKLLADEQHKKPCAVPVEFVPREELFARADVISLHCPLTEGSRQMIRAERIAGMKPGVLLLNTARGGLLNEADVARALETGQLGGLGVDVAATEPIPPDSPLLRAPNCIITPHVAWVPKETRQRCWTLRWRTSAAIWRAARSTSSAGRASCKDYKIKKRRTFCFEGAPLCRPAKTRSPLTPPRWLGLY